MSTRTAFLVSALVLTGCQLRKDEGYTLYRGSVTGPMRIHVATFDASDGDDYNRENCDIAAHLFGEQPGVKVRYWCEKGRYRS